MSLSEMIAAIKTEVESLQEQIESGLLAYSELQKQLTIKKGEDTKNLYKGTCLEGVNLDYFGQSAIVVDVSASGFFICGAAIMAMIILQISPGINGITPAASAALKLIFA